MSKTRWLPPLLCYSSSISMKTTRVEIWLKIRQSLQYFKTDRSSWRFGKKTALTTMAMNIYQLFFLLWLHRSHKKIPKIYLSVKCACLWFWTLWPEAVKSKVTYQTSTQTESPLQKVHFLMRYGAGRDGMTGRREPIWPAQLQKSSGTHRFDKKNPR